jgi:hypothetical protein
MTIRRFSTSSFIDMLKRAGKKACLVHERAGRANSAGSGAVMEHTQMGAAEEVCTNAIGWDCARGMRR